MKPEEKAKEIIEKFKPHCDMGNSISIGMCERNQISNAVTFTLLDHA